MIARKCRINSTTVEFRCPHRCGATLRAPSDWVGPCVVCGRYVLAPRAKATAWPILLRRLAQGFAREAALEAGPDPH
jgi:hypothetical protein